MKTAAIAPMWGIPRPSIGRLTKERDGIHVTNIQQNFDCGNVVTA